MTIGERIKYYREQRGWTQAELAQKMGYASKSGVSRTENAGDDVGTARVFEFAKALGVMPYELLGREVSNPFEQMYRYFSLNEKYKKLADEYISKLYDLQTIEEKELN